MSQVARKRKAEWNEMTTRIFLELCVKQVYNGNRPGTSLNKTGWKNVGEGFLEKSGLSYDRKQHKNKWDTLKKEWQIWRRLIGNGTTGVGWDPVSRTITATSEWWDKKLQEVPDASRFRGKGIENETMLDVLFLDTMATGEDAFCPSMEHQALGPSLNDVEGSDSSAGLAEPVVNLEDLETDINASSSRKVHEQVKVRKNSEKFKKKGKSSQSDMSQSLDRFREVLERSVTSSPQGCSITDVLKTVKGLPGGEEGGPLFAMAIRIFRKSVDREIFMVIEDLNLKVQFILDLYHERFPNV